MNYITTNIRIPEDDYLLLKQEAAKSRKSFSAVIREKIHGDKKAYSGANIERIMKEINKEAQALGKRLKGFDSLKVIREMRYKEKW